MKLFSSIIALAVLGQIVPALSDNPPSNVYCRCSVVQNSLSDFFSIYRMSAAQRLFTV